MLWLMAKTGADQKAIVSVACDCAVTALKHTKDPRVKACIDTVRAWVKGKATIEQVQEARAAAYAAAAAAAAAYASYAAAYATNGAADAAAAYADAAAAYAYAGRSAEKEWQREQFEQRFGHIFDEVQP